MFTIGPLSRLRERATSPQRYMADPFSSSFVALETWNPSRYYEETGQTPKSLPTGTTGQSASPAPAKLSTYLPFVLLVVVIWVLERRKLKIFARAGASA
jgi:hypothetical protein